MCDKKTADPAVRNFDDALFVGYKGFKESL